VDLKDVLERQPNSRIVQPVAAALLDADRGDLTLFSRPGGVSCLAA
jgi:hypothetical protein